jgi:tetratricopeptide (TPR) repeat protein
MTARSCSTITLLLTGIVATVGGCGSADRTGGPYAPLTDGERDPARAQELAQQASRVIDADPVRAEELLRQALGADLYHGPAHNNLGTLYLEQGKLYEAAGEFEWARKLMPGHPDPRMNLALTLERAGRTDDALATYATALEVYPDHIPTIQALARLQLRTGRTDDRTPEFLDQIAMGGESEEWKTWARRCRRSQAVQPSRAP